MKTKIKTIIKIMLFPLMIALCIVRVLLDMIIRAECWVVGVGFLLLTVFSVLAVINRMWLQLGIFLLLFALGALIVLVSTHVLVVIAYHYIRKLEARTFLTRSELRLVW